MADETAPEPTFELRLSAYGVRIAISTNSEKLLDAVKPRLPPAWTASNGAEVDQHFSLTTRDGLFFDLSLDNDGVAAAVELEVALDLLEVQIRFNIAQHAPEFIFVHAGAVGYRGKAILIPGETFSGKTTLVSELVRAGAEYYSDDYAVLGDDGLLRPYAKPLSVRSDGLPQVDHDVSEFGGIAGEEPLPVGLVVVTHYRPGGTWKPNRLSPGDGVLALLAHTVPAQDRPDEALKHLSAALHGGVVVESERGEAREIVDRILESVPV